jgi:V/A-type H+-transporting ATPase subunit F
MSKIAILTDPFSAEMFKLTDFHVESINKEDDLPEIFLKILNNKYEIVFITENLAKNIIPQIRDAQKTSKAIISVISDPGGSQGLGDKLLKELKESVIGI